MPIDIYSMRLSPRCRAVLMTAKQLNIELNIKPINLMEQDQLKPEYIKLNPAHTVPTLDDNGFVLWESRAIIQYLCNKYAPGSTLYPKDPKKRAVVDRWLNFDMSLGPSIRDGLTLKMFTGVEPTEDKVNALKNNIKLVNQLIGDNKFLTGSDLTIADLSVVATLSYLNFFNYDLSDCLNLKRWQSTLKAELTYFDDINHFETEYITGLIEKYKKQLQEKQK